MLWGESTLIFLLMDKLGILHYVDYGLLYIK